MVEATERLLGGSEKEGLPELRLLLEELLGARKGHWCLAAQEPLAASSGRVLRLRFANDAETLSVVAKRLAPETARRNALVVQRWLPAIGLGESCARLLGSAAARDGSCTWQLYEDLGPWELDLERPDRERVQAAIALIVRIHTRFAGHALLGEVRLHGNSFGIHFFQTNVQDAICALEAVKAPAERHDLCARLLDRLCRLREELPARAGVLAAFGGPETLLHGDLWAINMFVLRNECGLEPRLIDWDRTGVGPISYDLSTFLLRFPERHRAWVLDVYRQSAARAGWQLPGKRELNVLFETAELARYANRVIWPALALAVDDADWGFVELEAVEQWFQNLAPVLPDQTQAASETALSR